MGIVEKGNEGREHLSIYVYSIETETLHTDNMQHTASKL